MPKYSFIERRKRTCFNLSQTTTQHCRLQHAVHEAFTNMFTRNCIFMFTETYSLEQ